MRRGKFGGGTKSKRKRTAPHNIADEFEREKHAKELEKFLKQLAEDGSPKKPLTVSQIMSVMRGAVREKWMYCPTKLAYLNMAIVPDDSPSTKRRWKAQCENCEEWFKKDDVAVDHIVGENSLKTPEDLLSFWDSIMNVGFDDLQVLCHDCHDIKSMMERYGYTEDEVHIMRKVLTWEKMYTKAAKQKELLISYGFKASEVSNSEKRREAIFKHFKENS
ncbi:phage protein [Vibrio phage RYC]|nr:phage protein [Vibrio phage RYC]